MTMKTNAQKVTDDWSNYEKQFVLRQQKLIQETTLKAEAETKKEAPVDTGFLQKNINSEIKAFSGRVKSDASYSGFVHWGTRFIPANPFMIRGRNNTIAWLRKKKITV